jgi:hypothetical protein
MQEVSSSVQSGEFAAGPSVAKRRLETSDNGRHLVLDDGTPFFYLADTAWTLFKRLSRQEVEEYLDDRVRKGFTTIQVYVLRGLAVPNIEGELPLVSYDPSKLNERFFAHVDWVVSAANSRGLLMSMVTTFGEHVRPGNILGAIGRGHEAVFDERNAYQFGRILGERYRDAFVLWLLGGDRNPLFDLAVWRKMAEGLKEGSGGVHLVSYHGGGSTSSSYWFHDEPWLDLNTIQSGHSGDLPNYVFVAHDRSLRPVKPTLDMEPCYENRAYDGPTSQGVIKARHARSAGYWGLLAGGAGHGYGANEIWQFAKEENMASTDYAFPNRPPTVGWKNALNFEGAQGMTRLRQCFERYPWHSLEPNGHVNDSGVVSGAGYVATATNKESRISLSYLSKGSSATLDVRKMDVSVANATWYDPRTGVETSIGELTGGHPEVLDTPSGDPDDDWVLVVKGKR